QGFHGLYAWWERAWLGHVESWLRKILPIYHKTSDIVVDISLGNFLELLYKLLIKNTNIFILCNFYSI
ncbi:MAG: hypothetical protein ACK5Q1_20265, partial [Limnobacter sp.]